MKILILGSGGREHALAWKISQSNHTKSLYIAPGNAGTRAVGTNVQLDILDFDSISKFIDKNAIEIIVVGPEKPLVEGIADHLNKKHSKLIVIGPTKGGAQLEGSKAFAKEFMNEFDIPTAGYNEFSKYTLPDGIRYIEEKEGPYVLKADGLAGGKGVLILKERKEAIKELQAMLSGKFGSASDVVVVEDFLDGLEFSVFVLTDGKDYALLPVAKDYKRISEGDKGPNTGGMGAVSPVLFVDEMMLYKVRQRIIEPTIRGISTRGLEYKGFIFFGLIEVNSDPCVIEYNCRLGDPETQVVLPRLENDLLELFIAVDEGRLSQTVVREKRESAVTVVCASGGYPQSYSKGYEIKGLESVKDSMVFHAGAKQSGAKILTNGGRVLAVTSFGMDKNQAVQTSLNSIDKISFRDMYYRRDIGFDLL